MYSILKSVIERGEYDLSSIVAKTNKLWAEGEITDTQREELLQHARTGAKPENGIDILAKLTELETRIKSLEEGKMDEGENPDNEYVPGKWYYKGNNITFNGKTYECTAPEGVVCVWSPSEYPAYWKEI